MAARCLHGPAVCRRAIHRERPFPRAGRTANFSPKCLAQSNPRADHDLDPDSCGTWHKNFFGAASHEPRHLAGGNRNPVTNRAFQDSYPDHMAHCYGCGRLNVHGHQIQSFWDGDESVCRFLPGPDYVSIPGYVYGGLLASLIDCHGTGTAAAAAYRAEARAMDSEPPLRFLTASLHVDYLKPTPLGVMLEVRGKVTALAGRKVTIDEWILAGAETTVRGQVVAVQVPGTLVRELLERGEQI